MNKNRVLIIGKGRVSRVFRDYLKHRKISFSVLCSRKRIPARAAKSPAVFILVSDDAIEKIAKKNSLPKNENLFHFSGSKTFENIRGMHPLFPFSGRKISPRKFEKIPFVCENPEKIKKILPWLKNPLLKINPADKPYYHALCCIGANFPALLWRKSFCGLNAKFKIPRRFLLEYFRAALDNFAGDPEKSFTGPLARDDKGTIKSHLKALKNDECLKIYKTFAETFGSSK